MIGPMGDTDPLSCASCGNTEEETGEAAAPEYCECCEETLCERCWERGHVSILR